MRGRSRRLIIAALMGSAIAGTAAADAGAQGPTVTALPNNTFSPSSVSVQVGQTVTWTNGGGSHNVHFAGEAALNSVSGPPWTVMKTFTSVGTFSYVCDLHQPLMSGTVTVTPAPAPPPTPGTPPAPGTPPEPGTPGTPATDTKAPTATRLRAAATLRRVVLRLRLDEDAEVVARLRKRGTRRTLARVTRELDAGTRQLTIRKRLRARGRYTIALRIEDAAGNVTTRSVNFTAPRR